jgi:hypothetical protein
MKSVLGAIEKSEPSNRQRLEGSDFLRKFAVTCANARHNELFFRSYGVKDAEPD